MALKTRRFLAGLAVVAAAGVVPVVTALPAQAAQEHCVNYLGRQGYVIGPKVREACSYRALTAPIGNSKLPNPACYSRLADIGVTMTNASTACRRA